MVNHADEPCVLNRYPPVMGLRQQCRRYRVDRPVSRDDADRIVDRRKDRIERRIALGDELLSGRAEPGTIGLNVFQAIGNLASAIGGAEHHHPAQPLWAIFGEIGPRQQATHGMADEMDRAFDAGGEAFDGRMDVFGQLFQRLPAARVAEIQRGESAPLDRRLHLAKRTRSPADSMQQDHAVP